MNLVFDALASVIERAEQRMDAYVPRIVRERCALCRGSGLRALGNGPLSILDTCCVCAGKGTVAVESVDVEAA